MWGLSLGGLTAVWLRIGGKGQKSGQDDLSGTVAQLCNQLHD